MLLAGHLRCLLRFTAFNLNTKPSMPIKAHKMQLKYQRRSLSNFMQKEDPFTIVRRDLLPLANRIRGDSPFSDSMHNCLLLHGRGHAHECSFFTLRDHPESHVVMWRYLQPANTLLALHCRYEEVDLLKEALKRSELIDWKGRLCVFHVPEYLVEAVKEVEEAKGGRGLTVNKTSTFTVTDVQKTLEDAKKKPLRCPAGFRVCRLGRAGVRIMRNTAEYDVCRTLDDMDFIAKHAPSAGLYEDSTIEKETIVDINDVPFAGEEEEPVAWVTTSFYGGLGTVMTKEEHRGRSYGRLITEVVVRSQAAQGYIPQLHIDIDNIPPLMVCKKIDNFPLTHYAYFMFRK